MIKTKNSTADHIQKRKALQTFSEIDQNKYIHNILDSLPNPTFILNNQRQIVYASRQFLTKNGTDLAQSVIGNRFGEYLGCINSSKSPMGCGTSDNCRFCGANNAMVSCQKSQKKVSGECMIHTYTDNRNQSLDYRITINPFEFKDQVHYIFTVQDISDEKRRKMLEKIFFHDIINKIGSLKGFINHIKDLQTDSQVGEFMDMLELIGNSIFYEINAQQQLVLAENGELVLNIRECSSSQIIEETARIIKSNDVALEKNVVIKAGCPDVTIKTDPVILQRILLNMLKNALEVVNYGETVHIGCINDKTSVIFWVKNPEVMPAEIKAQIFKRSFSTKGSNRGIGTYSMKVLGENYLKGKVDFISTPEEGTVFRITLNI